MKFPCTMTSNIKDLGTVVLPARQFHVVGANGSGKSALVHSIEYALTGVVADVAGRDVKKTSYLESMTPRDEDIRIDIESKPSEPMINVMFEIMSVLRGANTAIIEFLAEQYHKPAWLRWKAKRKSVSALRAHLKSLESDAAVLQRYGMRLGRTAAVMAEADLNAAANDIVQAKDAEARAWADMLELVETKSRRRLHSRGLEIADLGGEWRLCLRNRGPITSGAEQVYAAVLLGLLVYPAERSLYIIPDRAYDPGSLEVIHDALRGFDVLAVSQGVYKATFVPNVHLAGGGLEVV